MNIDAYTGRPYDFRRYNCWHHVTAVRADAGLHTPAFDVAYVSGADAMFESARVESKGLVKVESPQDFDAVLMGTRHGGRIVWHSGVYVEGYVSHCDRAARQVRMEALSDLTERYQEIEFWR